MGDGCANYCLLNFKFEYVDVYYVLSRILVELKHEQR